MRGWLQHPLRISGRLVWLAGELALAALGFLARWASRRDALALPLRAQWLHASCRRVRRVFGLEVRVSGHAPLRGLLACNHLGYLDILALGSLIPAVFVAKRDVKSWPVFGWFASLAGTLFIPREQRTAVGRLAGDLEAALNSGVPVVLFPEGTSSDGWSVLPFRSAFLEPAVQQSHAVSAGLIRYELLDGDVGEEVCYWKDMTLVPHLINLLSKRHVRAWVRFSRIESGGTNRKALARRLH